MIPYINMLRPRMKSRIFVEMNCTLIIIIQNKILLPQIKLLISNYLSLCSQMEFHAGNFLAHTVHTLLYVHHVREITPDVVDDYINQDASTRPIELITLVMRAAVAGILKCCDLTWRELSKGGVFDVRLGYLMFHIDLG